MRIPEVKGEHRREFLAQVVLANDWRLGAEIGVKSGMTLRFLLSMCPSLAMIAVDPWVVQLNSGGPQTWKNWSHKANEGKVRDIAAKVGDRLVIYKMFSHEAAEHVSDSSLDFVFLDADHGEAETYRAIVDWEKKVKAGGGVLGHDAHWPTVRRAVEKFYGEYQVWRPNNVWYVGK